MSLIRDETKNVNLMKYLPEFLTKDKSFKATADVLGNEHNQLKLSILDVCAQFFISTATWGLSDWERIYAVVPPSGADYELRRAMIMAKIMAYPSVTVKKIQQIANLYVKDKPNGECVTVREINEKSEFVLNIPLNEKVYIGKMKEAVIDIKPAHLLLFCVIMPEIQLKLNGSGGIVESTEDNSYTEFIKYKTFDFAGLNAPGKVIINKNTKTTTITRKNSVFTKNILNQNQAVEALNSDNRKENKMSKTDTTTIIEKSLKPIYSLNHLGSLEKMQVDVGHDVERIEKQFIGGTLGQYKITVEKTEKKDTKISTEKYFSGKLLNGEKEGVLNTGKLVRQQKTETGINVIKTKKIIANAFVMNSHSGLNNIKSKQITTIVHICDYQTLKHWKGANVLNCARRTEKTKEIYHEIITKGKKFNPQKGFLLNSKARLGYIAI